MWDTLTYDKLSIKYDHVIYGSDQGHVTIKLLQLHWHDWASTVHVMSRDCSTAESAGALTPGKCLFRRTGSTCVWARDVNFGTAYDKGRYLLYLPNSTYLITIPRASQTIVNISFCQTSP